MFCANLAEAGVSSPWKIGHVKEYETSAKRGQGFRNVSDAILMWSTGSEPDKTAVDVRVARPKELMEESSPRWKMNAHVTKREVTITNVERTINNPFQYE